MLRGQGHQNQHDVTMVCVSNVFVSFLIADFCTTGKILAHIYAT